MSVVVRLLKFDKEKRISQRLIVYINKITEYTIKVDNVMFATKCNLRYNAVHSNRNAYELCK